MAAKNRKIIGATIFALFLCANLFAQWNFIPGNNFFGRIALSGNILGLGIGNFTSGNLPLAALHINTNINEFLW